MKSKGINLLHKVFVGLTVALLLVFLYGLVNVFGGLAKEGSFELFASRSMLYFFVGFIVCGIITVLLKKKLK
ncbi:MAG: hypothetical protein NTY48_05950 [Candidatus Diapherotrites archaeon]|nr:hypothetical protein [Candidatus Diapherotrites archaeon]